MVFLKYENFAKKIKILRESKRIQQLEVDKVVLVCLKYYQVHELLDVGTGSGLFAEAFSTKNVRVTGIDSDFNMLHAAMFCVPNIQFLLSGAELLPFRDDSFDLVFMGMFLHVTDDPYNALKEARRVTKNGVAILEWPYPKANDPPAPDRRIKPEEITDLSRTIGFMKITRINLNHTILYLLKDSA